MQILYLVPLTHRQGDSGGPLIRATESGHVEVVGIVSWGIGCGSPDYFGVYTRVFTYVNWIIEQIQVNFKRNIL